jgi:hypothetical protein
MAICEMSRVTGLPITSEFGATVIGQTPYSESESLGRIYLDNALLPAPKGVRYQGIQTFSRVPILATAGDIEMAQLALAATPVTFEVEVPVDPSIAAHDISAAWEQYKKSTVAHFRDGLQFGRVCHGWQTLYKSQGSRQGKGFDRVLQQLGIPKTTAYRWIRRYQIKCGLRAGRNEVETNRLTGDRNDPSIISRGFLRRFRDFFPTDEQKQQFQDDVLVLGGYRKVVEMFLWFVSQKALETRARRQS